MTVSKKIEIKRPGASSAPTTADDWVATREKHKRFTIDLPTSLHTKLKVIAVKRGQTMVEIITTLVEEMVNKVDKA